MAHAATTIGGRFRALLELGAWATTRVRGISSAAALIFALALVWLCAVGWWNYVRPHEMDTRAYEHYQQEVATCRVLPTSESRYDCVAKAMISRDQVNFGTAMFVFLPPILLIFAHYIGREIRANIRDREHARLAEQRSRRQASEFRREMLLERAAAKATHALLAETARQQRMHDAQESRMPVHDVPTATVAAPERPSKRA